MVEVSNFTSDENMAEMIAQSNELDNLLKAQEEASRMASDIRSKRLSINPKVVPELTKKSGYTAYEIAIWVLKAEEIFTSWYYWDGDKEAIGFGQNLKSRKDPRVTPYLRDGILTWDDGVQMMKNHLERDIMPGIKYLEKKRGKKYTEQQRAAIMLYAYNTGSVDKAHTGRCCKKKDGVGCNRKDKDTRTAHTRRRVLEQKLFRNEVDMKTIEVYKKMAAKQESKWKKVEAEGKILPPTKKTKI